MANLLKSIPYGLKMLTAGACLCALQGLPTLAYAAGELAKSAAASPPAPASSYKPKPGETLDQVIAKTMAKSPLSIALLRQAFIDQNPQGIVPGKIPKLRKGVTLQVPDHDRLLRGVLASVTPVPAPLPPEVQPQVAPPTPEDRKRWIQYP
jgi:Tfp pilus assembly protein FimV